MRVVITGALGHIGSRLIHGLPAGAFSEVVLLDNLSTQRYCSLFALPQGVPFRFVEGDVRTADLEAIIGSASVVVHLAAITNAALSEGDEDRMEAVNFEGTSRVARACATLQCRLFLPSTTSIYAVQDGTVDDDHPADALRPQSPYAASKLRAEQLLAELGASHGLRYCVARFATVYDTSVGMRFHTAVNKFCWQASLRQPLSVWRTALDQLRPYLDLDDAVRAIAFVIAHDLFDKRAYNVVSQNATVRQVIDLIREEVPDVQVELVDAAAMNHLSYAVLMPRLNQEGFTCRGDLRSGIGRTLALLGGLRQAPSPHDPS